MTTRIVFGGGEYIEVSLDVEQVRDALREQSLSELELTALDSRGKPIRAYVNRDQVAFIMDAESSAPATAETAGEHTSDTQSPAAPETSRQPVTDLWGNPIRPRRRRR